MCDFAAWRLLAWVNKSNFHIGVLDGVQHHGNRPPHHWSAQIMSSSMSPQSNLNFRFYQLSAMVSAKGLFQAMFNVPMFATNVAASLRKKAISDACDYLMRSENG